MWLSGYVAKWPPTLNTTIPTPAPGGKMRKIGQTDLGILLALLGHFYGKFMEKI